MIAAVVQMTSTDDVAANLERASQGIRRAVARGAELVALPENFAFMREEGGGPNPAAQPIDGEAIGLLRELARQHGVVIAGGTIPEEIPGDDRVHNTSVVIDADGQVAGVYRKIHLFDVDLPGASLQESKGVVAGEERVVAATQAGKLGLSVCYDLRFPELYRELVTQGAEILLVPSAFTVPTGSDHWQVLLRARAIENQAFVVAAAQVGTHNPRRRSYGRSMIIDPWGTVLCTVGDGEGIGWADLDPGRLAEVRQRLPALQHRKLGL